MKNKANILYNFLALLTLCGNIIGVFTVIYLVIDYWGIGGIIDQRGFSLLGMPWFDQIGRTVYFSAITLFSVGYGDLIPVGWSRLIAIMEATIGYILPAVITVQYLGLMRSPVNKWRKGDGAADDEDDEDDDEKD
jgi:potassium channel LctB